MSSPLKPQECSPTSQEEAEFSMKFVITALKLTDDEEDIGFNNILTVITFDGNVFKIENFKANEEGGIEFVGHGLDLRLTPEQFSEKLCSCPIMLNLSRGCIDMGTLKLEMSQCFVDAVMCEEFSSQTCTTDLKFIKDGEENATMTLVFQVSRKEGENFFKGLKKQKKDAEEISSETSISCSTDCELLNDFETEDRLTTSESYHPTSSNRTKSTRSKCFSDIATSLDIRDYSDSQQTFCNECRRFSISGVTCDNKNLIASLPPSPCKSAVKLTNKGQLNCKKSVNRICSECFEDLSVIPNGAPCPKCTFHAQLQRKLISFKSDKVKTKEGEKVRECIKSILEEIFFDAKDRLVEDWQRLKRKPKKRVKKVAKNKQRSSGITSNSLELCSMPRCTKVLKVKKKSKLTGLRKKHPGVVLGHEFCQGDGQMVPKNMGWLWNVGIYGLPNIRRGWRPGAVKKSVAKIMKVYLTPPAEPAPILKPKNPPTLRVQKTNGEFMVIMNPLDDDAELTGKISPIVFKISKSEEGKKRLKARDILKDRGIVKTCDCKTINDCSCFNSSDKNRMKCELTKVSKEICLKSELNFEDLKYSSESEIDVEFTPPFAAKLKNANVKRKPVKVSYAATQYEIEARDLKVEESEIDMEINMKNVPKKAVKMGGKSLKEKSVKIEEKTVKTEGQIAGKVGGRSSKQQSESAATEDGKKSKSSLEFQRRKLKKKDSLNLRESPSKKTCNYCAPKCDIFGCQSTMPHRYTTNYNPMYAQCPAKPKSCFPYAPIYY